MKIADRKKFVSVFFADRGEGMQAEIIKLVAMSPKLLEKETILVRCADCCFYRKSETIARNDCALHGSKCDDKDFCSWAVKKN